jgi:tripartite-type tricarboxylate transporter receptor subunit TctC
MAFARCIAAKMLVSLMVMGAGAASGQDYPYKPIRIVTSEAGADSDFGARLMAQGISGPMGQQVIVDNRPSNLVAEIAAKAQPDGHNMLIIGGSLWIAPLLQKTPYDPLRDFSPITL